MNLLFPKYYLLYRLSIFSIVSFFFIHCTNGSIGNSLTEKSFVLQRLVSIINTNLSNVLPVIYLFDDQGDSNVSNFSISSNSINYNITVNSQSDLLVENYSLYLAKAGDIFARNQGKHLGDNVVAESAANTTSITERFYSNTTQNSILFQGLQVTEDDLGYHYKKTLASSIGLPRGNITKMIVSLKPTFQINITNSGTTKTFSIPIASTPLSTTFDCPLYHSGSAESILNVRIKFSDIFKDSAGLTPIHTLFVNGTTNSSILISFGTSLANSDSLKQYNCIKK